MRDTNGDLTGGRRRKIMGEYKLRDRHRNLSSTRFPSIHSYVGFIYRRDANPFGRLKVFSYDHPFESPANEGITNLYELSTLFPVVSWTSRLIPLLKIQLWSFPFLISYLFSSFRRYIVRHEAIFA